MTAFADTPFGQKVSKDAAHLAWLGAALVVLGSAALVFPLVSTLVITVFVGWLLVISGFAGLMIAFSIRGAGPFFAALLFSLLTIAAGTFIIATPIVGEIAITISLGVLFMVQGAFESVLAFELRPARGWISMLISAAASILLSLIILCGLPKLSLIALGILIGINFISSGIAYMAVGMTVRREIRG
ncbi:HdeD family acid-resistance protein [Novosphingobium sp. Fuku2-ISO-50]|uniref:HdeD family acid-resistance protein n=1 Tax=Novosphingobium sp. Fuku2-ISO-50 TaxID=1739114 RepID=UPI00076DF14C|nr:DUF308 domain-containing protein [Novosphingobium sp. Fuku2-ISO-50]KUR76789.1 hypothetical protein AQZ50_13065 [Novosphingobium sp. Fuku2-ISO-50]